MDKGKIIIASLGLIVLLLSTDVLAQGQNNRASTKQKANSSGNRNSGRNTGRNAGKYANQEVSYRQTKGAKPPAGNQATQLLPYVEQDNLKTTKPKQQNLLPYMEQSNLRRRNNPKRR